jgi:hypothetical protein
VVREGVGTRGEMTQALYAHINNIKIKILKQGQQPCIQGRGIIEYCSLKSY